MKTFVASLLAASAFAWGDFDLGNIGGGIGELELNMSKAQGVPNFSVPSNSFAMPFNTGYGGYGGYDNGYGYGDNGRGVGYDEGYGDSASYGRRSIGGYGGYGLGLNSYDAYGRGYGGYGGLGGY
jgi:hypothetical protein